MIIRVTLRINSLALSLLSIGSLRSMRLKLLSKFSF